MKLLALETATEACSAALYLDGEISERYQLAPREHTALILPMVDGLLAEAGLPRSQLDAVAFGCGPGAFTGVRIATGVAQGIAFALELPVVPVSTLATLAQGAQREFGWRQVAAAIDARMGEVYWGSFTVDEAGVMQPDGEERVCPPGEVPLLHEHQWHGIGSGWQSYASELAQRQGVAMVDARGDYYPHALDVATLAVAALARGEGLPAEQALPRYLRDQVAQKPK
ncbi:MAG: tRNA (adenosine(37)-N6)-threonylcarbamoyltransferase complex dimerization subunit type 1 TsaB [Gammaproteobacteria bacterium]|nr:tRNA (adenosine(37)-N6)-threonylcarbamoyltransferase complex dimerization subunit type 1 TsaB [Gammaproteobacteria bacterium]